MARHFTTTLAALLLLAAAGCEQAPEPQFHLNMLQMASNEVTDPYQEEIANVLGGLFGTPDEPFAFPESGLDPTRLKLAAGPAYTSKEGVTHGLYRRHCVHCHGITGDGRGPTARFLNPYPRDYRQGVFKFKSTYNPAKPTDDDLHNILVNGVPGTSMPSFSLLPSSEVEALIEYVKYLAIRGEMEQRLVTYVYNDLGEVEQEDENGEPVVDDDGEPVMERIPLDPANDPEQAEIVKAELAAVLEPWLAASESIVAPAEDAIPADDRTPEEIAESAAKGRELFYGTRANCFTCHGPTGLGDGQTTDYDNWQKDQNTFLTDNQSRRESLDERYKQDDLTDEDQARLAEDEKWLEIREAVAGTFYPIRNAIPRNLRKGIYRGGRRRIDIFHRVHQGIPGTPMPASGASGPGAEGPLTEAEIWNVVDYVLSLPYEPASGPQPALVENPDAIVN